MKLKQYIYLFIAIFLEIEAQAQNNFELKLNNNSMHLLSTNPVVVPQTTLYFGRKMGTSEIINATISSEPFKFTHSVAGIGGQIVFNIGGTERFKIFHDKLTVDVPLEIITPGNGLNLIGTSTGTLLTATKNNGQLGIVADFKNSATTPNDNLDVLVSHSYTRGNAIHGIAHNNGVAGFFENNNPTSTRSQLGVYNVGLGDAFFSQAAGTAGRAGYFENNASNNATLIYGDNRGTGAGIYLQNHLATGTNPILWGIQNGLGHGLDISVFNTNSFSSGIKSTVNSKGNAGSFTITNALNDANAIYAESNGKGTAMLAQNTGVGNVFVGFKSNEFGKVADFNTFNINNADEVLRASTLGLGRAGSFTIDNVYNENDALFVKTNGFGNSIKAESTGLGATLAVEKNQGGGEAAKISIGGTSNFSSALIVSTNGTGNALEVSSPSSGNAISITKSGSAGLGLSININNTSHSGGGINVFNMGVSSAGVFSNTNSTNPNATVSSFSIGSGAALLSTSNGSGLAVSGRKISNAGACAFFEIANASNSSPSLSAATTGSGRAATFEINNTSSSANALYTETDGVGNAFLARHAGSSGSIAAFQSGTSNVARIDKTGKGFFNGGTQNSGADLAEAFEVEGNRQTYEEGDVLAISTNTDRKVEKSNEAYSSLVAGVYATKPGVLLTEENIETSLHQHVPMGVVGVIPTKVCNEGGRIKRGDLIVSASRAGYAMKADPSKVKYGQILGKALENFEGETGKIKVLVNIH